MARINVMIKATPLHNVQGRVDYISNPERQEYLMGTYSTAEKAYWKELAAHCQEQAKHSKTKRACEGREFMVPLANELAAMEPAELAKLISDKIKELTGTENSVAIHWNKRKTNYHAHIVVSENQEINEISYGAALTRNTYYDASGKRSTKKECVDQEGNLKPGCKLYAKGSRIGTINRFGSKDERISSKSFLKELKFDMAAFQNELLQQNRFKVFDRKDIFLAQQHIGKNTTPEQQEAIKAKNALVRDFNAAAIELLSESAKAGERMLKINRTYLEACRKNIKTHKLTENWIKAVRFYLQNIRKQIAKLQNVIEDVLQEFSGKKEPVQKPNLNAAMLEAERRAREAAAQQSRQKKQQRRQKMDQIRAADEERASTLTHSEEKRLRYFSSTFVILPF